VCEQKNERLAFTTKGKTLYAIKLERPSASFVVTGAIGRRAGQVKSVRLLGSDAMVRWAMTSRGLQITPPADLGGSVHAWAFEIVTDREQHTPNRIQPDAMRL
jgi:hypothetical protein